MNIIPDAIAFLLTLPNLARLCSAACTENWDTSWLPCCCSVSSVLGPTDRKPLTIPQRDGYRYADLIDSLLVRYGVSSSDLPTYLFGGIRAIPSQHSMNEEIPLEVDVSEDSSLVPFF